MADHAANIIDIGKRLYARGLVAGTEGNISMRIAADRIACTPSGMCKGRLVESDICSVAPDGSKIAGDRKPSSEMPMHLAIYAADAAVGAVVHAHPPFATTFAVLGQEPPVDCLPESAILFGRIPLVPYATTGTPEMGTALTPFVADHSVAILENHGAVSWAADLETAYNNMEMLEAVCRVLHLANQVGTPQQIAPNKLAELQQIRTQMKSK